MHLKLQQYWTSQLKAVAKNSVSQLLLYTYTTILKALSRFTQDTQQSSKDVSGNLWRLLQQFHFLN